MNTSDVNVLWLVVPPETSRPDEPSPASSRLSPGLKAAAHHARRTQGKSCPRDGELLVSTRTEWSVTAGTPSPSAAFRFVHRPDCAGRRCRFVQRHARVACDRYVAMQVAPLSFRFRRSTTVASVQ
jgi:hypothetical protein